MPKYDIYVSCPQCHGEHPIGIGIHLDDGPDEKRSIGLGPEHDWSSHAADAFGYMAIAYEEPPANSRRIRRPPPPRIGTHWSD